MGSAGLKLKMGYYLTLKQNGFPFFPYILFPFLVIYIVNISVPSSFLALLSFLTSFFPAAHGESLIASH